MSKPIYHYVKGVPHILELDKETGATVLSPISYLPECRRGHASSPGALYNEYEKAFDAAEKAREALGAVDFNRRDYHEVNGFDSIEYGLAKTKRIAMLKAIRDVIDYCEEHLQTLGEQKEELKQL